MRFVEDDVLARRYDKSIREYRIFGEEEIQLIKKLIDDGLTCYQIAKRMKRHPKSVYRAINTTKANKIFKEN